MTRRALFLLFILLGGLLLPACSGQAGVQLGVEGNLDPGGLLGGDDSQPAPESEDGSPQNPPAARVFPVMVVVILFLLVLLVGLMLGRQTDR